MRNVGKGDATAFALCDASVICNNLSELSTVLNSSGIATVGMFNIGTVKLFGCVGIGAGGCFFECIGDGGTGDVVLGVRLIRRGCVVNDVSTLFDDVMSFFPLIGGGGIMPCVGSIFIGTGREIAMSVVGSVDVDGAGAFRFTPFVGPVRAGAGEICFASIAGDGLLFGISL